MPYNVIFYDILPKNMTFYPKNMTFFRHLKSPNLHINSLPNIILKYDINLKKCNIMSYFMMFFPKT